MTITGKRKVCILGGGIGGLATAYYLTNDRLWKDRYESVTVHQIGWRLGGKCASSRNPDACNRIEEHGIHLFGGFYFNAFEMMNGVYKELARPPAAPLSSIEKAFLPNNAVVMWEFVDQSWRQWSLTQSNNGKKPWDGTATMTTGGLLAGAFRGLAALALGHVSQAEAETPASLGFGPKLANETQSRAREIAAKFEMARKPDDLQPILKLLLELGGWIEINLTNKIESSDHWRRAFLILNYAQAMFTGYIRDKVWSRGFDAIDNVDFAAWLKRHGASGPTMSSPLPVMTPNVLFAYLDGDTSRPPTMGAGGYLQWSFLSFNDHGAYSWLFAAGTGETVIAPLYEVLKARGVGFAFFNKVENLALDPQGKTVQAVRIGVQATLANGVGAYNPLVTDPVSGLIGWPAEPDYDQLAQGGALKQRAAAGDPVNFESYWTDCKSVETKDLVRGRDYDDLVLAISIGAFPFICPELIKARGDWRVMIDSLPAIQTQAFQIWLDKPIGELAVDVPKAAGDIMAGANYLDPTSAFADMSRLVDYEGWPKDNTPKTILYFCGAMAQSPAPPGFDDHAYPARQYERVKWQAAQFLQAAAAPFLPGATVAANGVDCGSKNGFNFALLASPKATGGAPFERLDQQFFRANIDPTERYVLSPPDSTKHRLPPGASGFEGLYLAGDWTRTGFNVGCVEATVMSGKLAATALGAAVAPILGFQVNA